jgi:hypothetical protein
MPCAWSVQELYIPIQYASFLPSGESTGSNGPTAFTFAGTPVRIEPNVASVRPERFIRTKRVPRWARIVPSSAWVGDRYPPPEVTRRASEPSGSASQTSVPLL